MQFHLNGFRPGDPDVQPAVAPRSETMPEEVDVLIVGCGPAGLTLAAQLAAFPEISTRIVERKSGPLKVGQADGIAVRSVEMFNAFGFAERTLREAYWVNETAFWRPDPNQPNHIVRANRIDDVEEGMSEFPHLILNQARVHDFYLDLMRNAPARMEPDYDRTLTNLMIDPDAKRPVTVTLDHNGSEETIRARYVVGCDGARSTVRQAVGLELKGDSANKAWGVMDVLAVTDFPDIRLKSVIQSSGEGSVLIIPREGGYMIRLYIEMDDLAEGERVASRNITPDHLIAAAGRIMAPYRLDVKEVAWWSVYEIGQRLTDRFDNGDNPCVFIAGDACHTHSPKAGQGMNVSMRDAFNLGWKLASVLRGQARPELLHTYTQERRGVAQTLIDFDREFAAMFSAQAQGDGDPAEFQRYFVQHGRFTAGTAIKYAPSLITGMVQNQQLAKGFELGTRFHSAPVIRLADAKPMHLGHVIKADGRWRLFLFAAAGETAPAASLRPLCDWLTGDPMGLLRPGEDADALVDIRAVLRHPHRDVNVMQMPDLLLPAKGRYSLTDYEKTFCPDPRADIFAMRGIAPEGCMVLVRPDQHVAHVLALDEQQVLLDFIRGIFIV